MPGAAAAMAAPPAAGLRAGDRVEPVGHRTRLLFDERVRGGHDPPRRAAGRRGRGPRRLLLLPPRPG